ncbi:GntR family transcriptional regulator [Qaidamihabitans albus]|uniref:GntR family transcriptional regulator n=1 Tax=Qaidamihabitans albus TaxID=2795733 RepID=UPI001F16BACB|nr:GntR family transcriptional regulator [Qaidamihabitans albus]
MRSSAVGGISGMQYSSKSDIVCAMLRELIISGEIAPAEPLRQRDLAARFGVSQTPVREALRRLESEGLVVNDPHRGATVRESRSGVVEDNAQIRAALESLGARLAARAISEEQLKVLRRLNDEMRTVPEGDERYAELNREFHFTIYESAASPMLLSMMRLLWQAMPAGPLVTRSHRESVRQHDELVDALAAGDTEQAAAITEKHILGTTHLESEIAHGVGS